jgi:hypothetical protein
MAGIVGGLLGNIINPSQANPNPGPTPEQAMLSQYLAHQQLLGALAPMGNTGTIMSTGATLRAAGANLGGAQSLATASDINAQNALQANPNTSLGGLLGFNQGAQSTSGNTGGNTFNSPSNTDTGGGTAP